MEKESLSSIIVSYMNSKGLTQKEFGKKCGISRQNISFLVSGINPTTDKEINPHLDTYEKLAHGMGITRDELLSRVEGKPMFEKVVEKASAYSVPIINNFMDIFYTKVNSKQLDHVNVPESIYKKGCTVAYKIADDGLSPVIQKNDIAVVWLDEPYESGDFVLTCSVMDDSLRCYKIYKTPKATILFGNLSVNPIVKELSAGPAIKGKVVFVQKPLL